jgi:myo-inositol 2-dehydrogenase/D-chiro-inositol 1-dehydrogenase/scyllo-inositol 2-dehydrogenase (NAD+)
MKRNIGVCIIGAGRAGMIHAQNYDNRVPHAYLSSIVEPNQEIAAKARLQLDPLRSFDNYDEALKDSTVKAVVITTPTKYHCDIAVSAANAGKHIFCEKPMAMNECECERMIEAARKNQVKLQIGFMRRFDESFIKAKKMIESGDIGAPVLIKSNTRGPSTPQKWMYDIAKSNGPLAEVNSHDIDTLRWFSGSEFKIVHALGGNYRCPEVAQEYSNFYDNIIMNAQFQNGMLGSIDGAQGVLYGYDSRVEILGTNGCILLGQLNNGSITVCNQNKNMVRQTVDSWTTLYKDAYLNEAISFIKSIINDEPTMVTGVDGKMAVQVVRAGNLSLDGFTDY